MNILGYRALASVMGLLSLLGSIILGVGVTGSFRAFSSARRLEGRDALGSVRKATALRHGFHIQLFFLCLADAITSVAFLMSMVVNVHEQSQWFCTFQGFLLEFGVQASTFWTCIVCFEMYLFIVKLRWLMLRALPKQRFFLYHLGWLPSVGIALSFIFTNDYGAESGWCWLQTHAEIQDIVLAYTPLVFAMFLCSILYIALGVSVYKIIKPVSGRYAACCKISRLGVFPLVFIVTWIVPLIIKLRGVLTPDLSDDQPMLMTILLPSQGFLNAVAYITVNKDTRAMLVRPWRSFCFCCQPKKHYAREDPLLPEGCDEDSCLDGSESELDDGDHVDDRTSLDIDSRPDEPLQQRR